MRTLEVLIAESRADQHLHEHLPHHYTSLVSTCGSSSGGSRLVTANRGQGASPEEAGITVGGHYVPVKNREFALPNCTIVIKASKSGGFRKNREG